MEKIILNEEAVHFGKVNCPKGFEINREDIKYEIMNGYIDISTFSVNKKFTIIILKF